jgi:hypothetical protein
VLSPGVEAVWDEGKAYHEATPTRERICLNGLWKWQPADGRTELVPEGNWGYFKVPGCWPGIGDYMQKDCQTVFAHPAWNQTNLSRLTAAWYERELTVPESWRGRRISLSLESLNSMATVHLDGGRIGEIRFPGGDLDITSACRDGGNHTLQVLVVALPLKGVMLSYTDSASARQVKGTVARRGLCGDVFLVSLPAGPTIEDVRVDTSVRKREISVNTVLDDLDGSKSYKLRAVIRKGNQTVQEFASQPFQARDLKENRFTLTHPWFPADLWDIDTPQHQFALELSLENTSGTRLDTSWTVPFGFRELWIDGRDFYLNGTRIFLSAVPLDNAQISAGLATYEATCETLRRFKSFGINFVYTHNYGCQPGSHLGFTEMLRAADDTGMLVSFSQPHFSHYDWPNAEADQTNGYARHAAFYVRAAQNHPAVVMYSMSHNGTGYSEDMNPAMIDGIHDDRDKWAMRNVEHALRAEAIVKGLDPSRIVYHHASGNLGSMHPINFYPNFVPIQELSDWFEHWATEGVKPAFTCEYGAPFTWDWTMYRGWYKGQREFGSAAVPWEFCLAEWNAQFFGDRAFNISDAEKANLRWEAKQFRAGRVWHRWDYPVEVGSSRFEERYPLFAMYLTDNWRAFRTWGLSANSPWEYAHFWKLRDGVKMGRRDLAVDWQHLQRPGFSPDYVDQQPESMDVAFERSDWIATPAAQALIRNNGPLLAYIAGKPARFSSKDHNFLPGETVEKQMIVLNNSRRPVSCVCRWSVALPQPVEGEETVSVETGQQKRIPFRFDLPSRLAPGRYGIRARCQFSTGEGQEDSFLVDVLSGRPPLDLHSRIALFDPKGQSSELFGRLHVPSARVDSTNDLSGYDVLVIGKSALTLNGPAPDLSRVRQGLKVLVFEQESEVLEKRLGFRVEEYGLRQVFPRVADHPILAGVDADQLSNWRGESTLLPPTLQYQMRPRYGPTVEWCDIPVTRAWRCGNHGNVASVLIEKPGRGNFLPLVDGGFGEQYASVLEYREGQGVVMFCQLDVTGRTEDDPAATRVVQNLVGYVAGWKAPRERQAVYAGDQPGKAFLESVGIPLRSIENASLSKDDVLVLGPGAGSILATRASTVAQWLKEGGTAVAIGLGSEDLGVWLPCSLAMRRAEYISASFPLFGSSSPLAGVSSADAHNRDPRELSLVSAGAEVYGDGILAKAPGLNVVFCQLPPWLFTGEQANLRRTYRRSSFLVTRLLANMGVAGRTPLLARFGQGVTSSEKRWLGGLYVDQPVEWDDPYRFFRW